MRTLHGMLEGHLSVRASGRAETESAIRAVLDDVQRYAQFRLGNIHDAEDATMETWHALRGKPEPFLCADDARFYAIGVCRRKVADIQRRRKWPFLSRRQAPPEAADADHRLLVGATLNALSDDQREVLALKYFHQFSSAEIAELMGRTPAAVNSLLQRARAAFAEAAKDWYVEEQA